MEEIVIVGGGPAGASCALWLRQRGYDPLLVEKSSSLGGLQTLNPYPNSWIAGLPSRSGIEYARDLDRQISDHRIRRLLDCRVMSSTRRHDGVSLQCGLPDKTMTLETATLVVASGTRPEEGGFEPGPHVLIGPGLAVHQTDFSGRDVAILGGGDNAFENYAEIIGRGAASVKIFARTIRARNELLRNAPHGDVIEGEFEADQDTLNINGRRFDIFLVLFGWKPNIEPFAGLDLELDENGFVRTDPSTTETSVANVYAIGEIANRAHPSCVTASADGIMAAIAIEEKRENRKSRFTFLLN